MKTTSAAWGLGALAVAALTLWPAGPAGAEDENDQPAYSPASGRITYRTYCANCHGDTGLGDGYIADTLNRKPADLTRIAARNGGEYPAERVRATIDGREEVKSHGRREMPLWGDVFLWPEGDSPERRAFVERRIGELVAFLETIQVPEDDAKK